VNGNIADLLVRTLATAGVHRIYGIVGDSLNGVTEALRARGDLDRVHVRNEEVAAFAAGAEAQLTGALAVCTNSCAPDLVAYEQGVAAARTRPSKTSVCHERFSVSDE
jgi:pyruvate dehydrogenase (quinone)